MASLIVVSGPNEGDYYVIKNRPMVIGRDEAATIQITDELVSRKHVQVRFEQNENGYFVLDMQSENGTRVNGRAIDKDVRLEDGDLIECGNSKIMFTMQEFEDRESALHHYKQRGERGKSTIIR